MFRFVSFPIISSLEINNTITNSENPIKTQVYSSTINSSPTEY